MPSAAAAQRSIPDPLPGQNSRDPHGRSIVLRRYCTRSQTSDAAWYGTVLASWLSNCAQGRVRT